MVSGRQSEGPTISVIKGDAAALGMACGGPPHSQCRRAPTQRDGWVAL